jgi:glycerate dehydrogenase
MRIVVLDGFTTNPGDLDWEPIQSIGEFILYDRTSRDEVVERAQRCEILLTNKTIVSRDAIMRLPDLRYIGVLATGYNIVDVKAAAERGIVVTNVPGYAGDSAAQLVFGFILEFFSHSSDHIKAVRDGAWTRSPDWSFSVAPIHELSGKTLGIIGLGAIGGRVALIGNAFGMRVIASVSSGRSVVDIPGVRVERLPVDELLALSDVVTLHCPLTENTKHLINAARLAKMKPTAILINTARGPLIDEHALADALHGGQIAGAGLDVLGEEPPSADNPLIGAPRCLLTPHIAWASVEARRRLIRQAAENIGAFVRGKSINTIM